MASVNVNRNLSDQFYRYKMPKLIAKVEGKGNGIKTVIVNMVEIAKALNRPPMYPTKYFGCVLGAQVNCDAKNERYIVNGSHEASKLQDLLDGFIKKYVLCASCDNPETNLLVNQKKGTINSTCKACGHLGTINSQDKLTTYILKCPPDQQNAHGASVSKKKKKDKEPKKNEENNGRISPQPDSDEFTNDQNGDRDDDGDWCDNADYIDELSGGAQKLTLNADLDKSVEERMQIFFDFAKRKISGDPIDVAGQKEIYAEAERLDIRDKAVIALCEILFRDPLKIPEQIKSYRTLFLRFTLHNTKSQKYLLKGFELTVKEFPNELLPRVPLILNAFYNTDILDEKVLIDWSDKKKSAVKALASQIHERAQKFIDWLKEAEEEDDDEEGDEEEEEEDLQVVYDERSRPDKITELQEKTDQSKPSETGKDIDIDIDAI
ncbi:Eukaryotic translation initiation factor 5 [Sarcoptes scabiei]|nr:Eukaryotic translation initiation factor 5 [Sarcoptes scabiei]UXI16916.1 hypothetical protein NH340_JMT02859 [Sarcoptes scabiei]